MSMRLIITIDLEDRNAAREALANIAEDIATTDELQGIMGDFSSGWELLEDDPGKVVVWADTSTDSWGGAGNGNLVFASVDEEDFSDLTAEADEGQIIRRIVSSSTTAI